METAFLWRWLSLQNSSRLSAVVSLVDEGRLELVGGGWSMNDEATTHYTGIIDNMAIGFRELKKHFGTYVCRRREEFLSESPNAIG